MVHRAWWVALGCWLSVACKKETANGLPPSSDWQAGSDRAPPPVEQPHDQPPVAPPDHTAPAKTAPKPLDKLPDGRVALGPFALEVPNEWTSKPVTSSMRAAHFEFAAKSGEQAELVVYYFGEGGAGGVAANLERWLGQFSQPDGKLSKDVAKIENTKVAGQDATLVSVTGRYATSQMPGGPPPVDVADGAMIGAIVSSPSGP